MLKSWLIQNFKPILDSGELHLAPVTVLAGRNSSGKSSLIQSILMIAQTLSNQLPDRVLLPNERMVQLGTYEDVLSEFSTSREMKIEFQLETKQELQETTLFQSLPTTGLEIKSVKASMVFNSPGSNGSSLSAVDAASVILESIFLDLEGAFKPSTNEIRLLDQSEAAPNFSLIVQRITETELDEFLKDVSDPDLRPYADKQRNYLGEFISDQLSNNIPFLVSFSHFFPTRFVGKFKFSERFEDLLKRIVDYLLGGGNIDNLLNGVGNISDMINLNASLSEIMIRYISELSTKIDIIPYFSGRSLEDLIRWFGNLRIQVAFGQERIVKEEFRNLLVQELMNNVLRPDFMNGSILEVTNSGFADIFSKVIGDATNFFTSRIRYLGPLRADPSSAQRSFSPTSQLDDVGFKGEYAAVVYNYNQNAVIDWYNPDLKQIEQGTLQEALDTWVRYLDVANQVKTEAAGNIGIAWKILVKKSQQARSLSDVGVGVSQILPILVMGLLSPGGTFLIVEQPELHLHPSVQARLGDFFMGLAKCGKQCLIETHSENLVSQLRYHIVEAGGQEKSDCLVYFVDQDEQGAARFNPIDISPKGNILNWPDGFFDETMLQEDRITAVGLKKRAKKASNG